ncbi:MAG TPA: anti-sigma factor [Pyrinomonadaceae bacterium]|nr:anti-sigma factor [Pyrinomonadaceae bacterium]
MVHDDYKEMIPAHALSALDEADERVLTEHLSDCAGCRRELNEWERTAASLALSAKPMEPSPQVRERLLSQIRSQKSGLNVIPLGRPSRTLWNSLGSLGSIAAVILFAALIISVVVLWQQNRLLRRENEFFQLVTAPGSRVAELSGTSEATGASAKLAYDKSGRAFLITDGLPRAPEGKEYQLWYIVDNKPLPGKSFAPDNSGRGTLRDQVPEAARDSATFAVTLEPAGGVGSPTGAIYLRGEL